MATKYDYDGDGKPNTAKDKKLAGEDYNKDGFINKADKQALQSDKTDRLQQDLFNSEYAWAASLVYSDPELKGLFDLAVKEGWNGAKFIAEFKGSQYYQSHTEEWLKVDALAKTKPIAYEESLNTVMKSLSLTAQQAGITIDTGNLRNLADEALRTGIARGDGSIQNRDTINSWLLQKGGQVQGTTTNGVNTGLSGTAGEYEAKLRDTAYQNGMMYTDQFFADAAKAVFNGGSLSDYEDYIKEQAAGMYPALAKQIRAGVSVRSLASGYISSMSQILELDPNQIDLNDPYIKEALNGLDENGVPKLKSLAEFETKLRQDPRWENTTNGKNSIMGLATRMMSDWGFSK